MLKSKNRLVALFFSFWIIYFAKFWSGAYFFNVQGDLMAGHPNLWADWAAHFTMGSAMAERGLLLSRNPLFSFDKFSYPFLSDMVSAVLLRMSENFILSFVLPSFILSILFVWSIYFFFVNFWKEKVRAVVSSLLFLLGNGLGFFYLAKRAEDANQFLGFLLNPPQLSTWVDDLGIKWMSIIDSMLIPQRSFALGFPLALIGLTLVLKSLRLKNLSLKNKRVKMNLLISGVIFGLMPLMHTHSFLAIFIILAFWAIGDVWQNKGRDRIYFWLCLAGISGLISSPITYFYIWSEAKMGFFQFYPGWLAREYQINWIVFWWRNWGVLPALAIMGWFFSLKKTLIKLPAPNRSNLFFFAPFFIIFGLVNLYLFQPYIWDNTKLLVWSAVGFSLAATLVLEKLAHKNLVLAGTLFFFVTASGIYDLHYTIRHDLHSYTMYTGEELELTSWIKDNTQAEYMWLAGDKHNHFLYNLAGRQVLMTYRGWMWSHGYDYKPVEQDLMLMFTKPLENLELFDQHNIEYILLGPDELNNWHANKSEFLGNFQVIKQTHHYHILQNQYN